MKRVAITPAGREAMSRVNATRLAAAQQFAASLTEAERKSLAAALAPLLERPEVAACLPEEASA
jgi:DNA-binding MarR family transcriptional regulator